MPVYQSATFLHTYMRPAGAPFAAVFLPHHFIAYSFLLIGSGFQLG